MDLNIKRRELKYVSLNYNRHYYYLLEELNKINKNLNNDNNIMDEINKITLYKERINNIIENIRLKLKKAGEKVI
jgi:hypothetical protein